MKSLFKLSLLLILPIFAGCEEEEGSVRNPFGVEDINNPFGGDVISFYESLSIPFSDETDLNATNWTSVPSGTNTSVYGDWSGRWNGGKAGNNWISGTALFEEKNGFIYILYTDQTSNYLTEARFENDSTLVGRYMNLDTPTDTSPWVGIIKSNSRIDGIWKDGRWDYRR